jgi:chaperonin GroEL
MLKTNVVTKGTLRKIQHQTLEQLAEILKASFGPNGSFTGITKDKMDTMYTKDGHTILSNVFYTNQLERAIKDDIEHITRYIVKEVGDGTTSAVILSNLIFKNLCKISEESTYESSTLITAFKEAVEKITKYIEDDGIEAIPEDIYEIALISTNNNEEIASNLKTIYEEFGMNVFIDVAVSNTADNQIKIYDGMTIESGYADTCYINDKSHGTATINKPHIYIFDDPIDTPQMAAFFDTIIGKNIITPANANEYDNIVPTVIMAPKISPDMSTIMRDIAKWLYSIPEANKPPLLIITNIYNTEQLDDIAQLCDAKTIKKYLDPKLQTADIEKGLAPNLDTITDFCGYAEQIESDAYKTKIINPKLMKNEDGTYTDTFNTMITFLEAELDKAIKENQDNNVTGNLKRRINSLKANLVEYLVGGIAMADRDSLRHAVEDAVLNCRSAARYGVGFGAGFEGLSAVENIVKEMEDTNDLSFKIMSAIKEAYEELTGILYAESLQGMTLDGFINKSVFEKKKPFNIHTNEYDGRVLASIKSDPVILDGIAKIVTLMFTANQFILETPLHNVYEHEDNNN